ncbi:hypothetical protein N7540_005714 [Penicillium herquei]|nr:hypothetical protein N7540_005714 [Penicillium herquei]
MRILSESILEVGVSALVFGLLVSPAHASESSRAIARVKRPTRCPDACASYDTLDWFVYPSVSRVAMCNETMLLDFNIFNALNDSNTHSTIHTCSVSSLGTLNDSTTDLLTRQATAGQFDYQLGSWGAQSTVSDDEVSAVLEGIEVYMKGNLQKSEIFGYSGQISAGIYLGSDFSRPENVESLIQKVLSFSQQESFGAMVLQHCGQDSEVTFGIALDLNGDLSAVQSYVQEWHSGQCVSGFDQKSSGKIPLMIENQSAVNSTLTTSSTKRSVKPHQPPSKRYSHSHDSYIRPRTSAPSEYSNGTCYTYAVQAGDSCWAISESYGLTVDEIDNFNNNTWAWYGCGDLQAGENICLSSGNPPYPISITNALCGPQVPGTTFNTSNPDDWAALNPCPLNACCDIWGQCGTTPLYCNDTKAATGAPGTAANGSDGCISNCGTTITNWVVPPSEYAVVGYYEASSVNRPCLQMDARSIDTSTFTHVNFAFGNIESDFSINLNGSETEFDNFLSLTGIKRLISFGGWDFSTDASTYMIFREGVEASNRATFAQNVADFVSQTGLDGVDFDWEYPGEPDIAGIPAGSDDEGDNYLAFLKEVKAALPDGTLLSVTAPSSYWYLKAFPIQEISEVVDYINYMTYDLHGTWDLGSEWAQWGCTAGDCLFSHVNMTETMWALAMLTKAGVATNQIMVGVSSYGRSFEMTTAGCYESDCTWDAAGAAGECTETAGYISNAEINNILESDTSSELYSDNITDIMVYNSTQWVGYMTNATKVKRQAYYETWNFGGTAEWAIDLEEFVTFDNSTDASSEDGGKTITIDPTVWTEQGPAVTCSPPCYMIMPPLPLPTNTTINFPEWDTHITWRSTTTKTTTLVDGNVKTFGSYADYTIPTRIPLTPLETNYINVWGQHITIGQTEVYQTSSVRPSPFPVTYTPTVGGNTTVIGGTTSVIPGFIFSSGSLSYTSKTWTGVFGGTTEVVGGTTLAPTITTVTPHPYPTTTNTPDSVLNTKKTAVTARSATSSAGPNSGGGSDSGSDDEENSSQTESTSTTQTDVAATITLFAAGGSAFVDAFPTTTDDLAALESIAAENDAKFSVLYGSEMVYATATTALCVAYQDPDSGSDGTYCSCSGSSDTYTTMSGAVPCGYTTLPSPMTTSNPYPYTFTDASGDIIACASEGLIAESAGDVSYCTGSRTTISINRSDNPDPYTWTEANGDIIACPSESVLNVDGMEVSSCLGTPVTVFTASSTMTSVPATTTPGGVSAECMGGSYGACVPAMFTLLCTSLCFNDDAEAKMECTNSCSISQARYCQEVCVPA